MFLSFDRDPSGDEGTAAAAAQLGAHGIEAYRVMFPPGLDANAYALAVTPPEKSLGLLLRSALPLGEVRSKPAVSSSPPVPAPSSLAAKAASGAADRVPASEAKSEPNAPAAVPDGARQRGDGHAVGVAPERSAGVSLGGHPAGAEANNSPALNAAWSSSWLWKTRAGASIRWRSAATAEVLTTARPSGPSSTRSPPWSGTDARAAQHRLVMALFRRFAPDDWPSSSSPGSVEVVAEPVAPDGANVAMQQPGAEQGPDQHRHAARSLEMVHVGLAVRIDAGQQRVDLRQIGEVVPVERNAGGRRHRDRWIVWLVEPPVACRPTTPLTIARSSTTWPIGV